MRKIEQGMNYAIATGKNFSLSNTQVVQNSDRAKVYLHGNHIASVDNWTSEVIVNTSTLMNWPTRTTMGRLRALGIDVSTRKGVVYLYGTPLR